MFEKMADDVTFFALDGTAEAEYDGRIKGLFVLNFKCLNGKD